MNIVGKPINNRETRRYVFLIQDRFRIADYTTWLEVYGSEYLDFLWDNHYIEWKAQDDPRDPLLIQFTSKGNSLFIWYNFHFSYWLKYQLHRFFHESSY